MSGFKGTRLKENDAQSEFIKAKPKEVLLKFTSTSGSSPTPSTNSCPGSKPSPSSRSNTSATPALIRACSISGPGACACIMQNACSKARLCIEQIVTTTRNMLTSYLTALGCNWRCQKFSRMWVWLVGRPVETFSSCQTFIGPHG